MARAVSSSVCLTIGIAVFLSGCDKSSTTGKTTGSGTSSTQASFTKLKIEDSVPGTGEGAKTGDTAFVLYTGKLTNGFEFDGNMDDPNKNPYPVIIGSTPVIAGWTQGLIGVKTGMSRKLSIPSELGYGKNGSGEKIPPNSDLVFDLKILYVLKANEADTIAGKDIKVGSGAVVGKSSTIVLSYKGTLLNGKEFEKVEKITSKVSGLYDGIAAGIVGMKAGGVRNLTLPPMYVPMTGTIEQGQMAYFEITVHSVK
jgi:peptidylprolyl isomerase